MAPTATVTRAATARRWPNGANDPVARAQPQADGRPAEQPRDAPLGAHGRSGPLRAPRRREDQRSEDHGDQESGDGQDGGFDVDGAR